MKREDKRYKALFSKLYALSQRAVNVNFCLRQMLSVLEKVNWLNRRKRSLNVASIRRCVLHQKVGFEIVFEFR